MDKTGLNLVEFEKSSFNVDEYVKKIAIESIYASTMAHTKDKLNRLAQITSEEIKQSVYKNYTNFMETSKEVSHLEGKLNQLRLSLEDQRKLLNLFKNLNVNMVTPAQSMESLSPNSKEIAKNNNNPNLIENSSLSLLLEQVEGCGVIVQKPGCNLLFHSDLDALHSDDYSFSHKVHAYLLSDAILLTLPQRKRNRTNFNASSTSSLTSSTRHRSNSIIASHNDLTTNNYQYKFHAYYELQLINIINIEDSKEIRNSFQLLKFPESLAFRCANAHLKKEWLENIENAKKQVKYDDRLKHTSSRSNSIIEEEEEEVDDKYVDEKRKENLDKIQLNNLNEVERNRFLREIFSEFDILLAQRDFEKSVEMLLKIKQTKTQSLDLANQLVYKQKETELINILRKDLIQSKERGNSKGVVKTGKRVVHILIKLKIYDEAIDLFIDYHKHLNSETLRKIKLEESNSIYMNNVLNLFFDNLRSSYVSFKEQFADIINYCYSTYLSWCDTEIEILIKKLQSQHYLGRHFDITIENTELIFVKAKEFLESNNFEVKFLFETKLTPILEQLIKDQHDILMDASIQRSKLELEDTPANNEQNKQLNLEKLLKDLAQNGLIEYFDEPELKQVLNQCTSSAILFCRGVLNFFIDCLRIYYQDINFCLIEIFTKLFKAELKIYSIHIQKMKSVKLNKNDMKNNICFIQKCLRLIQELYFQKTGLNSKHLHKVDEKYTKFRDEFFLNL